MEVGDQWMNPERDEDKRVQKETKTKKTTAAAAAQREVGERAKEGGAGRGEARTRRRATRTAGGPRSGAAAGALGPVRAGAKQACGSHRVAEIGTEIVGIARCRVEYEIDAV
jgi:hypothetical protein